MFEGIHSSNDADEITNMENAHVVVAPNSHSRRHADQPNRHIDVDDIRETMVYTNFLGGATDVIFSAGTNNVAGTYGVNDAHNVSGSSKYTIRPHQYAY